MNLTFRNQTASKMKFISMSTPRLPFQKIAILGTTMMRAHRWLETEFKNKAVLIGHAKDEIFRSPGHSFVSTVKLIATLPLISQEGMDILFSTIYILTVFSVMCQVIHLDYLQN